MMNEVAAEELAKYRSKPVTAKFYGVPITEFDRDQLIGMINWLLEYQETQTKARTLENNFWRDLALVRR